MMSGTRHYKRSGAIVVWSLLALFICATLLVFGYASWSNAILANIERSSQLSQIMAIETTTLKRWQESGALKQTLRYEDSGSSVVLLQRMLSQDDAAYPEHKITGYFGDQTKAAVARFQKEYGLPISGVADTNTVAKLNELFLSQLCPEPETAYPELWMRPIQKTAPLPLDYVPPNLETISGRVPTMGVGCLRSDVVPHLMQMFADANAAGVRFTVTSGYRKPEIQQYLYTFWKQTEGERSVNEVAQPGMSEHQLGTAVDLTDDAIGNAIVSPQFAASNGGAWLAANAYKYGFVLSYPEHKLSETGYIYEPWHWRYVGIAAASAAHIQNTTFNENNFDDQHTPKAHPQVPGLVLSAQAFESMYVSKDGKERVLISHNPERALPIASMTKLMVALVASNNHKTTDDIVVTQKALRQKGLNGKYHAGDTFTFNDALKALLIGSHNEMAVSIADSQEPSLVSTMNDTAKIIGLTQTHFSNVTGLDPAPGSDDINFSTPTDLVHLARYIAEHAPQLFAITTQETFNLHTTDGTGLGEIHTTNKLLGDTSVPFSIYGGKTGETPRAKQNLVLATEAPCDGALYSTVVDSTNSFDEMKKLLWYVHDNFDWTCK